MLKRSSRGPIVAGCIALAAVGCKDKSSAKPAGDSSAEFDKMFKAVPADATGVVFFDLPEPAWSYLSRGVVLPMTADNRKAFETELTEFLDDRVGLDVRDARAIVAFVRGADFDGAIMASKVSGKLKGGPIVEVEPGEDLVVAHKDGILIAGSRASVSAALAALNTGDGLMNREPKFASWIAEETGGAILGAGARMTALAQVMGPSPLGGLEYGALAVSKRGLHVALKGSEQTLLMLSRQIETMQDHTLRDSEAAKEELTRPTEPALLGALSITQYHTAKNLIDAARPKLSGDRLEIGIPADLGEDPTVLIATAGILSAVAIPAFLKYIKKSKSTEAVSFARRMADGAAAYYAENAGLPPSSAVTPPKGSCCSAGEKCMPVASLWAAEPWPSLQFSVDDPHYYSYEFENQGDSFTARAYGDLDCNGEYSTFEVRGRVVGDRVVLDPDASRINELE